MLPTLLTQLRCRLCADATSLAWKRYGSSTSNQLIVYSTILLHTRFPTPFGGMELHPRACVLAFPRRCLELMIHLYPLTLAYILRQFLFNWSPCSTCPWDLKPSNGGSQSVNCVRGINPHTRTELNGRRGSGVSVFWHPLRRRLQLRCRCSCSRCSCSCTGSSSSGAGV